MKASKFAISATLCVAMHVSIILSAAAESATQQPPLNLPRSFLKSLPSQTQESINELYTKSNQQQAQENQEEQTQQQALDPKPFFYRAHGFVIHESSPSDSENDASSKPDEEDLDSEQELDPEQEDDNDEEIPQDAIGEELSPETIEKLLPPQKGSAAGQLEISFKQLKNK